jgi:hypothetical protein
MYFILSSQSGGGPFTLERDTYGLEFSTNALTWMAGFPETKIMTELPKNLLGGSSANA